MQKNKEQNIGVVLSGGGARANAHIGVLQALNENGIFPTHISGASAGALIGALYCNGHTPKEILELAKSYEFLKIFKIGFNNRGLTEMTRLKKFLNNHLIDNFNTLQIPLYISVTNLNSGVCEIKSKGRLIDFILASCAIPLLFIFDFFVLQTFGISFLSTEFIHLKVASFIQMLVLTYAIMYRMKEIKEENELRLTEMRIFMKRQEIMDRKNVERLMEDVYLENLIMHYDLDGLEIKLLQYISEGKPNEKIARKLKMTETDIEELTKELYEKLEVGEQIQQDHRMLEDQPDYIYN